MKGASIKSVSEALLNARASPLLYHEGLPGLIFLGFIFSTGFIRVYLFTEDLLRLIRCMSISAHHQSCPYPPALVLTLTRLSPSPSRGVMWNLF